MLLIYEINILFNQAFTASTVAKERVCVFADVFFGKFTEYMVLDPGASGILGILIYGECNILP